MKETGKVNKDPNVQAYSRSELSLDIQAFSREIVQAFSLVNPRRACAARVTVLGLCVCVSVTQHPFHVIIRVKNDNNLLSGR